MINHKSGFIEEEEYKKIIKIIGTCIILFDCYRIGKFLFQGKIIIFYVFVINNRILIKATPWKERDIIIFDVFNKFASQVDRLKLFIGYFVRCIARNHKSNQIIVFNSYFFNILYFVNKFL